MHPGQLDVSVGVVRRLVDAQFPQWRTLPLTPVRGVGTVNALFRLGPGLTLRFPLRPGDPAAVRNEARAAGELLGRTRFPTPAPVAVGEPGPGYPWPWSVQTWLPGRTAFEVDAGNSVPFAEDLAEFVLGVRAIDARGRTFDGAGRGGCLADSDDWMRTCLSRSVGLLDVDALRSRWETFRELPRGSAPDVTSHRDLIPGNVLVAGERLAGVLDVGGLGPADPALDLVAAWHLLAAGPRAVFRAALGVPDDEQPPAAGKFARLVTDRRSGASRG
ncbi:aminoglycoside phosphotransferase family protein [Cryptosporangium arvum]|uniref:aminoglycoside phosphotransferase family protein n=1 Tax=Cryptosporangium arvum TaxID=80871 RepID=UPI0004B14766|nr:aminoglycoside phosphotransferase family protein [Cryptosporangium arvum]